ncbi:MAG: hypothetical protein AMJ46_14505, partial [Latescibacteria bacterium DG_63]
MSIYINGVKDTAEVDKTNAIESATDRVWIGHGDDELNQWWSYPFTGYIDEVRISAVARSQCWIETAHNNQSSPSTFYAVGVEESHYSYRKQITIDHTKVGASCSSDLTDFPVLVSIQDDADLLTTANGGKVENQNGYDIVFMASDGRVRLSHEVEKYDGNSGTLVAWVKVPTLKANEDTVIYMYYGNSAITSSQENAAGVWDSNYAAVWHLKETTGGSGAIKNSTSYSNDGTNSAGLSLGATGKMNGAIYFDGAGDYVTVPSPTNTDPANLLTVSA